MAKSKTQSAKKTQRSKPRASIKTSGKRAAMVYVSKDKSGWVKKTLSAESLLGFKSGSSLTLPERVTDGIASSKLRKLASSTGFDEAEVARFVGLTTSKLANRDRSGKFTVAESDKLVRLAHLFELSLRLFNQDQHAARQWLREPRSVFGGASPLEHAKTEAGAREVEQLVGRIEEGIPS